MLLKNRFVRARGAIRLKSLAVTLLVAAGISISGGCASTTPLPPAPEFTHSFSAWAGQETLFAGYWARKGPTRGVPYDLRGTFVATDEAIYMFVRPMSMGGTQYIEPRRDNLTETWTYRDIVELKKARFGNWIELRHRDGGAFEFISAPFGVMPDVVGSTPVKDAVEMMQYRIKRDAGSV